jgi:hypothetical protein
MPLRDPVAIYNAANNLEAHLVGKALIEAGVEAFVTEDNSQVGTWMFGLIPEIHKRRCAELRDTDPQETARAGTPIEVLCAACGQHSTYPPAQSGSVQQCRHCGAYVDVEGDAIMADWPEAQEDEETEEGS